MPLIMVTSSRRSRDPAL